MAEPVETPMSEEPTKKHAPDESMGVSQVGSANVFFAGPGEMRTLMRQTDWAATPFGPIADWPQSLITAAGICLNSRFPMVLWWGPEQLMIYNDAWRPVLGRTKHPAVGKRGRDVWPEIWHIIGPMLDSVLETGQATWQDDQLLMVDRNGYLEEAYFTYSYSPIHLADGRVGGAFSAVSETTARFLGERRLRTLRDLGAQAAMAKTVEDAISNTLRTLTANQADVPFALLYLNSPDETQLICRGIAPVESVVQEVARTVPLVTSETSFWAKLRQAFRTGETILIEDVQKHAGPLPSGPWPVSADRAMAIPLNTPGHDRSVGVLLVGINPCRAMDAEYETFLQLLRGHIATAITNARAYEEEKKRAEALAELDRAKTTFFSNVSHELRTPLTLMLSPVEELLAKSHTDLPPAAKSQLELVNRNGLRLLRLVNSLLDFSRIESGRMRAAYEATDLAAVTAELASNFRSACEKAGLRLIVDCPALSEPVYVDRDMWEKIVLNLVSNAFKFTFEGEIEVSMRQESDLSRHVILTVRDTGVGIPADELPRMFERFHRIEGSRGRTHEGTGIGLALVLELVKLHGGVVRADSTSGEGSEFTVTIPLGTAHLDPAHISAASKPASAGIGSSAFVEEALRWLPENGLSGFSGLSRLSDDRTDRRDQADSCATRPRIMVVDDNADMREYVARLLSERFEVVTSADGQTAFDHARRMQQEGRPPDLVLSDVMMPRLDGFGLLRKLREDPALALIPLILLSARAGEEARIEAAEAGADDYLIKPFSARELLARVESQIKMALLRRKVEQATRESEQRFRDTANAAPAMLWVTEPDGLCTFVSRSWYEFSGQTENEAMGLGWLKVVHPEDQENSRRIFLEANERREPFTLDYRLRRADGEYHWCIDTGRPRFDEAGAFQGYVGSVIDITERKRAEEALLASERRFSLFMQNLPGLAWLKDAQGRYCYVNEAAQRVFRRSTQDLYGKTDREVFPPETAEQFMQHDREAFAHASGIKTVETLEHADGVHHSLVAKFPIHADCGESPFIGGIGIDITDRIRMEQQLKASQERLQILTDKLEQLVEERTHELVQSRDELRGLATELNLTEQRERRKLATELHDHLQQTLVLGKLKMGQSKRFAAEMPALAKIINETDAVFSDALQYTRTLVAELSPPVLRDHGLAAGLKWLAEYMKKHEVSVAVTVPDGDDVRLPEDQAVLLFQCVRELLINSSKHAGTGHAKVTMERGDGNVRIVVGDDGAGFDLAAAAIATTGASGGTPASKFGLFSIRERMRALGGSFHLESSPGRGTTATLLLPSASKPSAKEPWTGEPERRRGAAVPDKSSLSTVHSSLIRVLLVDDHAMVRQGLRSVLDAYADMQVVGEARDGIEAVKLTEELRPRVVVMDINMPNMNGIEATTRIKARWPETTIIGISVNSGGDNSAAMQRAGAVTLLTKEAAVEQLHDIITVAVKKPRRRDDGSSG